MLTQLYKSSNISMQCHTANYIYWCLYICKHPKTCQIWHIYSHLQKPEGHKSMKCKSQPGTRAIQKAHLYNILGKLLTSSEMTPTQSRLPPQPWGNYWKSWVAQNPKVNPAPMRTQTSSSCSDLMWSSVHDMAIDQAFPSPHEKRLIRWGNQRPKKHNQHAPTSCWFHP